VISASMDRIIEGSFLNRIKVNSFQEEIFVDFSILGKF